MSSTRSGVARGTARPLASSEITLLVADSDRRTVADLRRSLEAAGFSVLVAHSGKQALKVMYDQRPHLVIVDAYLADQDGLAVCQRIKRDQERLGFVPVLVMLDTSNGHGLSDVAQCEADVALTRPVQAEEVVSWVHFLLRIKHQIDGLVAENQALAIASRQLDMLRSDIIANVSHELVTPLVQIKSAVSLLTEDINQGGSDEQRRLADMASQAVGRLEGTLDNIKQLAQAHDIRPGIVAISEAVDLALRHIERSWASRQKRNRVEAHLEENLPLVVGDKRAIARLLQLLLDNALKFSPDESPVYVLGYATEDRQVWVGVQDFGIGIAPELHKRIFDAFYQVDTSTTRSYGGTGTGLTLALLIANNMGTSIEVDSTPGQGSTFWFMLPVIDPDNLPGLD